MPLLLEPGPVGRREGDVGPELTRIREKYDRTALLDSILNPSAGIAFGYDTWLVETKAGLLYSGFVLADGFFTRPMEVESTSPVAWR